MNARLSTDQTHEPRSPSPFRERVYALVGSTTWREGGGSRSTEQRPIPAEHMIAAALAFGRRGKDDIGPDIAFDMATGRMGHHRRVCEALGRALSTDRARWVERLRPYHGVAAWAAYCAVIGHGQPERPEGAAEEAWKDLVAAAALVLERLAEDALALAARKGRQA